MKYNLRKIILISEETGDRKDFKSINAAARFLGATFMAVQRAALYNGRIGEWRVYESPDSIRVHIQDLENQLKTLGE